ncbi:uncharacterized protein [Littorina saxatilis]|uniref:uncharacterized protein n=1 Tax=Littorina saxatilis TaxID=31220 RepID=UPI0038B559B7
MSAKQSRLFYLPYDTDLNSHTSLMCSSKSRDTTATDNCRFNVQSGRTTTTTTTPTTTAPTTAPTTTTPTTTTMVDDGKVGGHCEGSTPCTDPNAVCTESICTCIARHTVDPGTLECKLSVGEECGKDVPCAPGLICDSETASCRIENGRPCGDDIPGRCQTGSLCDLDNVCRLLLDMPCKRLESWCVNGTTCDYTSCCKTSIGLPCNHNHAEPTHKRTCLSGAECVLDTCRCNSKFSDHVGDQCVPKPGRVGGKCRTTGDPCTVANSACRRKFCYCRLPRTINPFDYTCKEEETPYDKGSSKYRAFLLPIFGITTGLILSGVVAFSVRRKLKQPKPPVKQSTKKTVPVPVEAAARLQDQGQESLEQGQELLEQGGQESLEQGQVSLEPGQVSFEQGEGSQDSHQTEPLLETVEMIRQQYSVKSLV